MGTLQTAHLWLQLAASLPGGALVKSLSANAGDARDTGLVVGSGRSPVGGNGNPLQYSCLDNPMDREAWRGGKELDMTEQFEHTVRAQIQVTDIKEIYNFLLVFILPNQSYDLVATKCDILSIVMAIGY